VNFTFSHLWLARHSTAKTSFRHSFSVLNLGITLAAALVAQRLGGQVYLDGLGADPHDRIPHPPLDLGQVVGQTDAFGGDQREHVLCNRGKIHVAFLG
jgi:hypothetical protein